MSTPVLTPFGGTAVALSDVPDPVFAQGMLGPGAAVIPDDDVAHLTVVAPISGTVMKAMPHAVALVAESGLGVLVHVGIDTVQLKGAGFEVLVEKRQTVTAGQAMLHVDAAAVRAQGYNLISPVVLMDGDSGQITQPTVGLVVPGQPLFQLST
ncbi:PTS sugar transporter subunit IIA [Kocuria sp.]|uniref:PTS sugar transporter subunit IIA n=1 Tax=Kocuria sp. TaxID=1871328 RepID=UPI0026DFD5E1|nr:PTS glucose transporter subunit IIA [Kocuria sp.]MDO5618142.1 PTS glucose transporter subunit IIA [Kocuria sp.]